MLETGIKAPEFTLPDQNGEMHTLSDYRGQKVILYFYPKDNTAGCTKQACGFGDRYPQITEKGAVVLNIEKEAPEFLPFIQREIVKYFKDDIVFSVHFGVKLHEKNGKLKDFISEIQ